MREAMLCLMRSEITNTFAKAVLALVKQCAVKFCYAQQEIGDVFWHLPGGCHHPNAQIRMKTIKFSFGCASWIFHKLSGTKCKPQFVVDSHVLPTRTTDLLPSRKLTTLVCLISGTTINERTAAGRGWGRWVGRWVVQVCGWWCGLECVG